METRYLNLSTGLLFLIFAFVLFARRSPNKRSNNFLGVLFLLIAAYTELTNFHFHSVHTNDFSHLSNYLPLDALLLMLMSPCLYFYVLLLLNRSVKVIGWSTVLHALPLLPCVVFNVLFYFRPVDERVSWLIRDFYTGSMEMTVINAVLYLQLILYLLMSFGAVRTQVKVSTYVYTNGFRTNIAWVRIFLLANILCVVLSLPICFLINNERTSIWIGHGVMNVDFIILFVMTVLKIGILDIEKVEEKKISYQMKEELAANYWETLTAYMEKSKPYLNENCSLRSLADGTNISETQLSKILHAHGKISCTDFINSYRLEKAIILLKDKSRCRKTIDTIVSECGFGSRSSFYRAFFKVYGMKPSTFRKQFAENTED